MYINQLTGKVIGAAVAVHRALGPGLLESTYEKCLAAELHARGLAFEQQYPVPLLYRGVNIDCGYRIDLFVERSLVVELKAVSRLEPIHSAQVLTYLKLSDCHVGLLINFNVHLLKTGIVRLIQDLPASVAAELHEESRDGL